MLNVFSQAPLYLTGLRALYSDEMSTLGSRMIQLRHHTGLSQERFGDIAGVGKSSVSQWEKGSTTPDTKILIMLANEFDFSLDWLLTGKGYAPDIKRPMHGLMKVAEKLPDEAIFHLKRQGDDLAQMLASKPLEKTEASAAKMPKTVRLFGPPGLPAAPQRKKTRK